MSGRMPRLMIVDDERHVRESLAHWFTEDGYDVVTAASGQEALDTIGRWDVDVIVSDIKMPGMDGLELQNRIHEKNPQAAIILVTAYASVATAVQALKEGAYDYMVKPFDPEQLSQVVARAYEKVHLTTENTTLKQRLAAAEPPFVVGTSREMGQVMELVDMVSPTETSVLIRGESGTGKELIARLIHLRGTRPYGPVVAVNCGALSESLLESELFGHEKGAFTGASNRRKGKIELADGGTLFLDEIGEVTPKVQVELLRALEERKITRLGGTQEIPVNFRLVCATNRDLEEAIREGEFREDLYFRINVFSISIPPLRERAEDIAPIADHFLRRFATAMGRQVTGFSEDARELIDNYEWPGNVRELANAIERALVVCRGDQLTAEHLPIQLHDDETESLGGNYSMAVLEGRHIEKVLRLHGFNVTHAAKALGIDRVTLYNKMRKYGIERP